MSIESLDDERNDFVAIDFGQLDSSAEANVLFHRIFHGEKNDFVADEFGQLSFRRKPSASANAFSCFVGVGGGWKDSKWAKSKEAKHGMSNQKKKTPPKSLQNWGSVMIFVKDKNLHHLPADPLPRAQKS